MKYDDHDPDIRFCPFCGAESVKFVLGVPRCKSCKAVFFLTFNRYARKSPRVTDRESAP
jgi:ribosomal protein L37AE/L43A